MYTFFHILALIGSFCFAVAAIVFYREYRMYFEESHRRGAIEMTVCASVLLICATVLAQ